MQNFTQKFRQSSIDFETPGFSSKKMKNLASSNYHRVQYFLLKLHNKEVYLQTFPNVYKRVFEIFYFV